MNNRTVIKSKWLGVLVCVACFFVPFGVGLLYSSSSFIVRPMLFIIAFIITLTVLFLPFEREKWDSVGRYTIAFPMVQYVLSIYSVIVGSFYLFINGKTNGLNLEYLFNRYLFFSICFVAIGIIGVYGIRCYRIAIHRLVISPLIILVSGITINHNIYDDGFVTISAFIEVLSALFLGIILSDEKSIHFLKNRLRICNRK